MLRVTLRDVDVLAGVLDAVEAFLYLSCSRGLQIPHEWTRTSDSHGEREPLSGSECRYNDRLRSFLHPQLDQSGLRTFCDWCFDEEGTGRTMRCYGPDCEGLWQIVLVVLSPADSVCMVLVQTSIANDTCGA